MSDISAKLRLAEAALAAANFTTHTGFARSNCPFCLTRMGKKDTNSCFSTNVKTGSFSCWRCSIRGWLDRSVLGNPEGRLDESTPAPAVVPPPEGYYALTSDVCRDSISADPARQYLQKRGVPPDVWRDAQIGCCLHGYHQDRIIVPVLSLAGDWMGWVGRSWHKVKKKYLNATGMVSGELLFNQAALNEDTDEPVLVMEGVFDALAYWPNAVAVLGMPKESQIGMLLATKRPVVVVLDGDAWQTADMLAERLKFEGARAAYLKLPPLLDPDEIDRAALWEEARQAVNAQD